MSVAIKIENVSKLYRLGQVGTGTISHDLNRWWASIRGKEDPYAKVGQVNDRAAKAAEARDEKLDARRNGLFSRISPLASSISGQSPDYVWALRDINLEVEQGEILGIIGRNGAGKSTLLKLLSRVTAPTEGVIKTRGRIASLLEVGTGFHPELTGRENIYLNGAILGMKRHEITKRLDEIAEFSGCNRYLDTPVKRYSSGMMVRLGFAVAAHLECEILIIDEVLAVGDVDFQRKCIGAMKRVADSGRTVLLVSHNLALVERLCRDSILLDRGRTLVLGATAKALEHYLRRGGRERSDVGDLRPDEGKQHLPHFTSVELRDDSCANVNVVGMGEPLNLTLNICAPQGISRPWIGIQIRTEHRELVSHIANREAGCDLPPLQGMQSVACRIAAPNLQEGIYQIDLILADAINHVYHQVEGACTFEIRNVDVFATGMPMGRGYGVCFLNSSWEMTKSETRIR